MSDTVDGNDVFIDESSLKNEVEENTTDKPIANDVVDTTNAAEVKKQNVIMSSDVFINEDNKKLDTIILPSDLSNKVKEQIDKVPRIDLLDSIKAKRWAEVLSEGLSLNTYGEIFVKTLYDSDADFKQYVDHNNIKLSASAPRFPPVDNEKLKGERAVLRINNYLGLGNTFQTPLWHSGIWVTFKPPADADLIELNRQIISDKINLGRSSYGLAFSNTMSFTLDRLVNFALAHLFDCSAVNTEITVENITKYISCQDIPSLLWGFVCTMYPKGFRYERGCVLNPEKCNHVVEEVINVRKLQLVNNAALTSWQKEFMSVRTPNKRNVESINRYKEELVKCHKKKIELMSSNNIPVFITLKSPSIAEHIESGHKWITSITELVEGVITDEADHETRNSLILDHGRASSMRQYSHWVESIEFDTNIIDDAETIEKTLNSLSADDDIRVGFINNVVDYINTSTISLICVPSYNCPVCGTEQKIENMVIPDFTNVIPIDVVQVFFEVMSQRLSKMKIR